MSRPPRNLSAGSPLSDRETEVLALVAAGEATPAISRRLGIAQNTVKSHLAKIYDKTNSRNRVDAVRYYLDHYADVDGGDGALVALSSGGQRRPGEPSLLRRQIRELEARVEQLKPAAGELERVQRALDALRAADTD